MGSVKSRETEYRRIWELCPGADRLVLPPGSPFEDMGLKRPGYSVNIIALGDVGATLLSGLRLLGGEVLESIGIYDMNQRVISRYEMEMNQVGWPFGDHPLPSVRGITEDRIFQCDMVVFCASKGVPPVGEGGDVRMAQLEANRKIASYYGSLAGKKSFKGIFAVVSDPVDPLCKEVLLSSGLYPSQVRGYGLGVMNKRAEYFARRDDRFSSYLKDGRAYGPHGEDLVIANSITDYDDHISVMLTELTVKANMEVRSLGYKPYIAPAISSGAISLLLTLEGKWNYSSIYLGDGNSGAFLGIKNRLTPDGALAEDIPLPHMLYRRVERAYENLKEIL